MGYLLFLSLGLLFGNRGCQRLESMWDSLNGRWEQEGISGAHQRRKYKCRQNTKRSQIWEVQIWDQGFKIKVLKPYSISRFDSSINLSPPVPVWTSREVNLLKWTGFQEGRACRYKPGLSWGLLAVSLLVLLTAVVLDSYSDWGLWWLRLPGSETRLVCWFIK